MILTGVLKYSEKKPRPNATLSTTYLKCMDPAPNHLHHGAASKPVCFQVRTKMTVFEVKNIHYLFHPH